MAIDDIVRSAKHVAKHVREYFSVPGSFNRMVDYGLDHYMDQATKEKLFEGKNDEERLALRNHLRSRIKERVERHQEYLNTFNVKAGKGAGLVSLLHQFSSQYQGTSPDYFGPTHTAIVASKALLELPTMYRHMKESHDWYGALEWIGCKPLAWAVPFMGAAIDYNVVPRIIKKRAIQEGVREFLEERNIERPSLYERIVDRVKNVAGNFAPAYSPQAV